MQSIRTISFLFLTLIIFAFYFFLINLTNSYSILMILLKNQLIGSFIFSFSCFIISNLIFIISFYLLGLNLPCSSVFSSLKRKLRSLIWELSFYTGLRSTINTAVALGAWCSNDVLTCICFCFHCTRNPKFLVQFDPLYPFCTVNFRVAGFW